MTKETVTLALKKVTDGRQLREMTESSQGYQFESGEGLSTDAQHCFVELQDYLQDYGWIYEEYTAVQKLTVNTELQDMLDRLEREGASLGIAVGRLKQGETEDPFFKSVNYYFVAPNESFPKAIMLNKSVNLGM